jgi:superfamily I DNA/RNA helicase
VNIIDETKLDPKKFSNIGCDAIDDFHKDGNDYILHNPNSKYNRVKSSVVNEFLNAMECYSKKTGNVCFAQFGKWTCDILDKSNGLAQVISHDFPVVILDEYQDTNYYQDIFVHSILKKSKGIFFTDKWQMIYKFRGSSIERLNDLSIKYSSLKKVEFNEIFRYKGKEDILNILEHIRKEQLPNYSVLTNGKYISIDVKCNSNWHISSLKSHPMQCSKISYSIFYNCRSIILSLLRQNKSVAILTRQNDLANRLTEVFFENKYMPRTISDTNEMLLQNRMIKKCLDPIPLGEKIPYIFSLVALCTMQKKIDDENIELLAQLNSINISRKRKPNIKKMWETIKPHIDDVSLERCFTNIDILLSILETDTDCVINFARKRYLMHCISQKGLTSEMVDSIMLQRQYIDSFSFITAGIYITTIHQSKGKEFDSVFIVDVENINNDANLLYVSHSRMKESIYPIKLNFTGLEFGR